MKIAPGITYVSTPVVVYLE